MKNIFEIEMNDRMLPSVLHSRKCFDKFVKFHVVQCDCRSVCETILLQCFALSTETQHELLPVDTVYRIRKQRAGG